MDFTDSGIKFTKFLLIVVSLHYFGFCKKNQSFFIARILFWISCRLWCLFLSKFLISRLFSSNQSELCFFFLPKVRIAASLRVCLKLRQVFKNSDSFSLIYSWSRSIFSWSIVIEGLIGGFSPFFFLLSGKVHLQITSRWSVKKSRAFKSPRTNNLSCRVNNLVERFVEKFFFVVWTLHGWTVNTYNFQKVTGRKSQDHNPVWYG